MECLLCGHHQAHKHGKTSKGSQRYYCLNCQQTFSETFDTIYYRRQVEPEKKRTNAIVRQQTGRWHRRQNKFAKVWEQTEATVRLVVSYFNWIWVHSRKQNTAAMRVGLAIVPWSWHDTITYPTLF